MRPRHNPLHWIGFLGAWVFLALVIVPMICFFVFAALIERAKTGRWTNANIMSRNMGKSFEKPLWWIRSLGGLLPIDRPNT